MSKDMVLAGLKAGRRLRCDRRDEAPTTLVTESPQHHPNITNSGVVQADEQSSYIEFWWKS